MRAVVVVAVAAVVAVVVVVVVKQNPSLHRHQSARNRQPRE